MKLFFKYLLIFGPLLIIIFLFSLKAQAQSPSCTNNCRAYGKIYDSWYEEKPSAEAKVTLSVWNGTAYNKITTITVAGNYNFTGLSVDKDYLISIRPLWLAEGNPAEFCERFVAEYNFKASYYNQKDPTDLAFTQPLIYGQFKDSQTKEIISLSDTQNQFKNISIEQADNGFGNQPFEFWYAHQDWRDPNSPFIYYIENGLGGARAYYEPISAGQHPLAIQNIDYYDKLQTNVNIIPGKSQKIDWELAPINITIKGTVTGQINNEGTKTPLPLAKIKVYEYDYNNGYNTEDHYVPWPKWWARADENGNYEINIGKLALIPSKPVKISYSHDIDDYEPKDLTLTIKNGINVQDATLNLPEIEQVITGEEEQNSDYAQSIIFKAKAGNISTSYSKVLFIFIGEDAVNLYNADNKQKYAPVWKAIATQIYWARKRLGDQKLKNEKIPKFVYIKKFLEFEYAPAIADSKNNTIGFNTRDIPKYSIAYWKFTTLHEYGHLFKETSIVRPFLKQWNQINDLIIKNGKNFVKDNYPDIIFWWIDLKKNSDEVVNPWNENEFFADTFAKMWFKDYRKIVKENLIELNNNPNKFMENYDPVWKKNDNVNDEVRFQTNMAAMSYETMSNIYHSANHHLYFGHPFYENSWPLIWLESRGKVASENNPYNLFYSLKQNIYDKIASWKF